MPSTIESANEFEVRAELGRCWAFFTNLGNIGGCIPGCESVTPVDDKSAVFTVKFSVGYISKTFQLKAKFKDVVPESQVSFVGEGNDAEAVGTVGLREGASPGTTALKTTLQIRPISAMGRTAVALLGRDLVKRQAEQFANCVKSKLESK
jgi:uncharacterized protein